MNELVEPAGESRRPALSVMLFNPFYYVAGGRALVGGLAAIIVSALLGSLGAVHLDGVLDLHVGLAAPWWVFVAEGLIDWLSLALLLLLAGKMLSRSRGIRAIDVLGTQALARAPYLLAVLVALLPGVRRVTEALTQAAMTGNLTPERMTALFSRPLDVASLALMSLVTLLALVWMIYLMYRAYAVSCNLKGARAIVSFIVILLLSEAVSKVAVYELLKIPVVQATMPAASATAPTTAPGQAAAGQSVPMQRAISLVDALGRGDMAGATRDFDSTMQAAMPAAKMQEVWGELLAQNGPFQERLNSKETKIQGFDVVFTNCRFEKATLAIQVTVTPQDGKVSGLYVRPKF